MALPAHLAYAVFESGTEDQLSEYMSATECRIWIDDAYREGETRTLVVRLAHSCDDPNHV